MLLLIDGYNLIGTQRGDLKRAREELIESLIEYRKEKPHEITLIFDGYIDGLHESSSVRANVRVMYTGIGERADQALIRLIPRGVDAVVISSDRAVQRDAWAAGAVAVRSDKFMDTIWGRGDDGYDDDDEYDSLYASSNHKGRSHKLSKKDKEVERVLAKL